MQEPENNPYICEPDTSFEPVEDIDQEDAEKQVELLREAIQYHDYRYYVENDPVISDRAYDRLFSRLEKLEQEFNLKDENSPTQRVGGEPLEQFETVEHVSEMLSLNASEEEEEVRAFDNRVREKVGEATYHCEPKFDGLSVELVYESGELDRAVTRGNGVEGDDITENVKTIPSVPLKVTNAPEFLAVRAEVYMPKDGFQQLNRERVENGEEPFANPRNAAAGTVRQLDPNIVAERPLDIYFYDIIDITAEIDSQGEAMEILEELGFRISKENRLVEDIDGFIQYREEMMEKREDLNYDIDGVVVKVNDFQKRQKMGETSAHPRWAYAYKFPAKTGETKVKQIVVQVGRTGKLTPVALLDPVDVKGVTISRATLHNESQAKKLGIKEGSKVEIERAGDVIPEVKKVNENAEEGSFRMPSECPVCGSKVVKEGEYHFCTGAASCPAQLKRGLQHYTSKQALDIEGIGEKVAEQLVDCGLVEELPDIYKLEMEEVMEMEKFSDRSAEKLLEQIESSKHVDLSSFLTGLGIRHVGKEKARKLAENFTLEELREAERTELEQLPDIGLEVSKSIVSFFEGRGGEIVEKLLEVGVEPERLERGEELEGLKIVITGSIEGYTREDLIDLLEAHGADVTSSVSSETDYLVVGENAGESKMEEAEENDVEKLDENDFRKNILSEVS